MFVCVPLKSMRAPMGALLFLVYPSVLKDTSANASVAPVWFGNGENIFPSDMTGGHAHEPSLFFKSHDWPSTRSQPPIRCPHLVKAESRSAVAQRASLTWDSLSIACFH